MSGNKQADKVIQQNFDRLCHTDSNRVLSFEKYPNGFYINRETDASEFFSSNVTLSTKRDKLSTIISQLDLIKKIGTTKLAISIPEQPFEQIQALKIINESIIVWTEKYVYKIPVSNKAIERVRESEEKADLIHSLEQCYQQYFLLPDTIHVNDFKLQRTLRCGQLQLNREQYQQVDSFLAEYFTLIFKKSKVKGTVHNGLQHSDLHYYNIFKTAEGELKISDIDMMHTNGYPFIDMIHFAVHLIRNIEQTEPFEPFNRFLNDKSYLFTAIGQLGFVKLSDLWLKYYRDEYILMYLDSQLNWFKKNQNLSDSVQQLETIKKKYIV